MIRQLDDFVLRKDFGINRGDSFSNWMSDILRLHKVATTKEIIENNSISDLIWNCFSSDQQMRDHDVIIKNNDFIRLISNIDDKGINWLDFNLSIQDKIELFERGAIAACSFLKTFNWKYYKSLRGKMISNVDSYESLSHEKNLFK